MTKATARAWGIANARSNDLAIVESSSPGRRGVTTPMTPARRTTGTTGMSVRNRRGTSRAATLTRRAPKLGRDGGVELGIYPDTQPGLLKSTAKGFTRGTGTGFATNQIQTIRAKSIRRCLIFNFGMLFAGR